MSLIEKLQINYLRYGLPVPSYLRLVVVRNLIREETESDSALMPWVLCTDAELMPLSKRWPNTKFEKELFPFARRVDCDELVCFELPLSGQNPPVVHLHYQIHSGIPTTFNIENEYETFWEWVHAAIDDVKENELT